jgi:hypothetical protein
MFTKISMLAKSKKREGRRNRACPAPALRSLGEAGKPQRSRGFTLVELLIYTAGMVVLVSVIIMIIVQLYGLYRQITIVPRTDRVGLIVVDRIVKDIRSGRSVDLGQSDLGADDGSLYMTTDFFGTTVDKFFDLSNGRITYQEDGGITSFLSPSDVQVTKFRFDQLTTDISQGIRVEIDITFQNGETTTIKEYQGFATLRHSYE